MTQANLIISVACNFHYSDYLLRIVVHFQGELNAASVADDMGTCPVRVRSYWQTAVL